MRSEARTPPDDYTACMPSESQPPPLGQDTMLYRLLNDIVSAGEVGEETLRSVWKEARERASMSPLRPGEYQRVVVAMARGSQEEARSAAAALRFSSWVSRAERARISGSCASMSWGDFRNCVSDAMYRRQGSIRPPSRKGKRNAEYTGVDPRYLIECRSQARGVRGATALDKCTALVQEAAGQGTVARPDHVLRYRSWSPEDHPEFVAWVCGVDGEDPWGSLPDRMAVSERLRGALRRDRMACPGIAPAVGAEGPEGPEGPQGPRGRVGLEAQGGQSLIPCAPRIKHQGEDILFRACASRIFTGGRKAVRWSVMRCLWDRYSDGAAFSEFATACGCSEGVELFSDIVDSGAAYSASRVSKVSSIYTFLVCYCYLKARRERSQFFSVFGSADMAARHREAFMRKCAGVSGGVPSNFQLPGTAGIVYACGQCGTCSSIRLDRSHMPYLYSRCSDSQVPLLADAAGESVLRGTSELDAVRGAMYAIGPCGICKDVCTSCYGRSAKSTSGGCRGCADFGYTYHCYRKKKSESKVGIGTDGELQAVVDVDAVAVAVAELNGDGDGDGDGEDGAEAEASAEAEAEAGEDSGVQLGSTQTPRAPRKRRRPGRDGGIDIPERKLGELVGAWEGSAHSLSYLRLVLGSLSDASSREFISSGKDSCRDRPMYCLETIGRFVSIDGVLHAACTTPGCYTLSVVRDECFSSGGMFHCGYCDGVCLDPSTVVPTSGNGRDRGASLGVGSEDEDEDEDEDDEEGGGGGGGGDGDEDR